MPELLGMGGLEVYDKVALFMHPRAIGYPPKETKWLRWNQMDVEGIHGVNWGNWFGSNWMELDFNWHILNWLEFWLIPYRRAHGLVALF